VNAAQHILIFGARLYRLAISPFLAALCSPLGLGCRFTPTCSQYGLEAVQRHGALRGVGLSVRRFCRCHPWGGWGHDPVPPTPDSESQIPNRQAGFSPPNASEPVDQPRRSTTGVASQP